MIKAKYTWGPQIWSFLHTVSIFCDEKITEEDFQRVRNVLMNVEKIIPCTPCKDEYSIFVPVLKDITYNDVKKDRMILFKWTFLIHNHVNKKIKKPLINYRQALEKWTTT